jgi:hypothetical protein
MKLLRKFLARSWPDKVLLVRAFTLVSAVRMGLGVLPFQTVQRLVSHPRVQRRDVPYPLRAEQDYQRRVVGAVEAIGRRLLGDKPCLVQALVAQRLMRRGGYDSVLRIGVAKDGRELLAHAWLERQGRVVIGGHASPVRYKPLAPVSSEVA